MSIATKLAKMSPNERRALLLDEMRKSHTDLKESAAVNPRIVVLLDALLTYLEQQEQGWK